MPLVVAGVVLLICYWFARVNRQGTVRQVSHHDRARPVSMAPRSPLHQLPCLEDPLDAVRGAPIPQEKRRILARRAAVSEGTASSQSSARLASDKNQVMDELLNQATIPADYAKEMLALFRDRSQDVHTRNFAV